MSEAGDALGGAAAGGAFRPPMRRAPEHELDVDAGADFTVASWRPRRVGSDQESTRDMRRRRRPPRPVPVEAGGDVDHARGSIHLRPGAAGRPRRRMRRVLSRTRWHEWGKAFGH